MNKPKENIEASLLYVTTGWLSNEGLPNTTELGFYIATIFMQNNGTTNAEQIPY